MSSCDPDLYGSPNKKTAEANVAELTRKKLNVQWMTEVFRKKREHNYYTIQMDMESKHTGG